MTAPHTPPAELPDVAAIEARAAAAAHAAREYRYCRDCGAVDSSGRAGWMCRTCGTILPSDCPDAKATAIAAKVARDLGCADLDDVPDALKRVLADNADAEIHRRVLTEQSDAQRTRADAAEEALTRLRSKHAAVYRQATHDRELRVAAEEALTTAREERDAARAEADALRAIVEGRTVAPTPADVAAHALAHPIDDTGPASNGARRDATTGLWLCAVDGEGIVVMALAVETDDQGPYLMAWSSDYGWCGTGDIRRAWPLDASGRPCPWPTVAAEAATGAALAGEGGVPSGALAQFRRIGRWGTCVDCPPREDGAYPMTDLCMNTTRYDHHLRGDPPTEADVRKLLAAYDALRAQHAADVAAAVAGERERAVAVCRGLAASVPPQWRGAADACADAIAAPTGGA